MGEGVCIALLPLTVGCVDRETFQPCIGEINLSSRAALLSPSILRILSLARQHPGNAEEMVRSHGPELLSHILRHLFCIKNNLSEPNDEKHNEELVAAVVALCQAPSKNQTLKTHLYSCLLLDLKLWSGCSYGLQKKLLSSLADMVFSEELTMRTANAVQMLLDGCRYCYWTVAEPGLLYVNIQPVRWQSLDEEMRVDMQRIWKRNLRRDDRCMADHGKEARFPFLDEDVMETLLSLALWEITDLNEGPGVGDKKILREVAGC